MNFSRIKQMAVLCLAICSHAAAQVNPGSSYLFQLPLPNSGGLRVLGYLGTAADLNPRIDLTGPANATRVIPTPDGQRVYLVTNGTLQTFDAQLQTLQVVPGIAGPIRNIGLTPDGKYLLIAGAQFYILNTSTNTIAATNLGISGEVADFAISADSTKAWVLQALSFFNSITPINLTSLSAGNKVSILRAGESISISPQGKLYVPTRNVITEYDSNTLQVLGETQGSFLPGRLNFNLDGTRAYFIDRADFQAYSIVAFNPQNRTTTGWPANIFTTYAPVFDEIHVAGPGRLFGLERSKSTLWEITDDPLSAAPINMPGAVASNVVFAAAVSNEIPAARYLYVLTEESARPTLARIALANNTRETFSNALLPTGTLKYVGIPPQTGASQVVKFNDAQTITGGGVAKTLLGYVTDSLGRPVFNQVVNFALDSGSTGATLSNFSAKTNANGFVQADVTVPVLPGTYTINLTADSALGAYTITVPGQGGGGGGGGGGGNGPQPRMTIYRGDGQFIEAGKTTADWAPITVKVVDANDHPLPGVAVTFTPTVDAFGAVTPTVSVTNEFGLASATYYSFSIPANYGFIPNAIRASSDYGSVEFAALIYNSDGAHLPISPNLFVNRDTIVVRRGDVTPNFFIDARVSANPNDQGIPLQGFGLRVGDGVDFLLDGPGSCVNDTKSDNLGVSHCDFQASCSLKDPIRIQMVTGETLITPLVLLPLPGSGQKLRLLSGNNQTANTGALAGARLIANITDNCGEAVPNQDVTWTITQGSATLSSIISKSTSDGNVSTAVTLGQTAGTVKVTLSLTGAADVVFTLTATVSVSNITLTSGGGQSVLPGAAFPSPLVFTLRTANGSPVGANISVSFALSGSGSLGAASAVTNTSGQVQVGVTAGPNPGPVTVTATYSNLSASASLTVANPTLPLSAASFSNTASGVTGLVPCGLATAVGNGLVPTPGVLSGISPFGPLPYQLGSIDSLRVNNVPAPIQAVSNQNGKQQVNFQVPCETGVGNATVVITVGGVATTVSGVQVFAGQPGIFTYAANNKIYGAVIRLKDGNYITPNNLAPTGENFYLILTGLGLVSPSTATNSAGNDQVVSLTTQVGVNNAGVPTLPARYLRGSIGVYYVEFSIPKTSTAAPGTVLLTDTPLAAFVNINGVPVFSQPGVLLPGVIQGQ
ncbi:MAG: hypothetical protein ABIR70_13550 [Bryobacteraceae bacterium]